MARSIEGGILLTGVSKPSKGEIDTTGTQLDKLAQARGLVRPTRTSMKFLNIKKDFGDIDESGDFNSEQDIKDAMKLANRLYELDGVVSNTIDVFVDFAISDFKFNGVKDDKLLDILEYVKCYINSSLQMEQRGLKKFAETITNQYYLLGNVFIEPKWNTVNITHSNGRQKEYIIPTSTFFYDPQTVMLDETNANLPVWIQIKPELLRAIDLAKRGKDLSRLPENIRNVVKSLPQTILDSATTRNGFSIMPLDKAIVLQRKKAPYNAWGTPYVARAFGSLAVKHKLRSLDMDTIEGLINSITIFRLGTKDHVAKTARINQFKSLMTDSPATRYLVWAHDVDAISVAPDNKIEQMVSRYDQINAEILEDLGMPKAFTVGANSSGGGADPWIQILQLMERLSRNRRAISNIIEDWAMKIAELNGFKAGRDYFNIQLQWKRNNLMSPDEVRQFVLSFYDRGLISKQTAIWLNDGSFEEELNNRKYEKKGGESSPDALMVTPALPFSADNKIDKNKNTSEDNASPKKENEKVKIKDKTTLNDSE